MKDRRIFATLILSVFFLSPSAKCLSTTVILENPLPGSLSFWGSSGHGLENVPAGDDFIAVATGDFHAVALRTDGSLVGWGAGTTNTGIYPHFGQSVVPTGNDFIAIAAGDLHSLALRSDGTLVAWGRNNYGQINTPTGNDFIAIACGGIHNLALREDGTLAAWGAGTTNTGEYPHYGQSIVPAGNDYVMIAAGATHSIALRNDGSLSAWGRNNYGQITVPVGNDFISISAKSYHNLALREEGSISAWGRNTSGQCNIPAGYSFQSISAGREHSLAIQSDGTLLAWGMNSSEQCEVPSGNHFTSIAAGYQHSLAISSLQYGIITPNGGEIWQSSTEHLIRWYFKGPDVAFNLQYSTDNGTSWNDIATVNGSDCAYLWLTPTLISDQYKIRAQFYVDDTENTVESDTTFSVTDEILPSLSLLSPTDSNIRWQVGKSYEILWNSTEVSNVDILLSIDNGYSWIEIASQIDAHTGYYIWNVPDLPTNYARIRIQDSSNPQTESISSSLFSIVKLDFAYPIVGLELIGGNYYEINITAFNSHQFNLYYSLDNGDNWQIIIEDLQQTNYNWLIPNHNSNEALLRLEDHYNSDIAAESEPFSISALITLLSPLGGENLIIGSTHLIEWTATNEVSNVLIDYSIDNGINWLPVQNIPYPAAIGFFEWTIPDTFSSQCLVKVINVINVNAFGISVSPFTISDREIIVTQPSGGEVWYPGTQQSIYWQTVNVETVNISYSYDGGDNWLIIAENLSATSSPYIWEIPQIGTMAGKIKVSEIENPMINGVSEGFFTIIYYNPPRNLAAEVTNNGVLLSWEVPYGALRESYEQDKKRINSQIRTRPSSYNHDSRWVLEGYNLYRDDVMINQVPITSTLYHDYEVTVGTSYSYYVTALYDEAESEPSNTVEVTVTSVDQDLITPLITTLKGNYPNPFNPETTICFSLSEPSKVTISIYNNRGQLVKSVIDDFLPTGEHRIIWDGRDERYKQVSSGVYFYRMQANEYSEVRKMLLLK
ncbi:MAG: T9SS type A sorting domain-containing protein [Candidatus Cloacimonetes bacterium]|nr:T9SS type A sorting domain-containing protein [Candidatus Cloacimonadota bacterium]